MKRTTIILMICGVLAEHVCEAAGVQILVPPVHSATHADHLYVVGRTGAPIVEIALNGKTVRGVIPRDSIFHALVWFGYGLNEIAAIPVYGDPTVVPGPITTVEVLSGPEIARKYERLFTPYAFHGSRSRRECLNCHKDSWDKLTDTVSAESCYECHRVIREKFRTHIPNDDRACAHCHRLGDDLMLLSDGSYESRNPCYSCHKDKIGQFAQDFIHGPVAGGSCTICHDPHGSVYEKNLLSPVAVLCPSCHDLADTRDLAVQHKPFEQGHCTECHDPHSTNNKWVLVKESQELCINCHLKIGTLQSHKHPYNVKPRRSLATPLKLTERGRLECLSCHQPHAGNAEHLLRTDQENKCTGCHPDR